MGEAFCQADIWTFDGVLGEILLCLQSPVEEVHLGILPSEQERPYLS
jgi:hypothetical protein